MGEVHHKWGFPLSNLSRLKLKRFLFVSDVRCPNLNAPNTAPQQGYAFLHDVGETFGPCLGRQIYRSDDPLEFPTCKKVKASMVKDLTASTTTEMRFKAWLWFDQAELAALSHLTLELVFSHPVDPESASVSTLIP